MHSISKSAIAAALAALLVTAPLLPARAQYSGPSPYLGFADSPFNGVGFSYFHLEDFEDGLLNTAGVSANAGSVIGPNPFTDSVDADDGTIDGSGASGSSLLNSTTNSTTFTFSAAALGALPTHAGIVWTDVGQAASTGVDNVFFEAFDAGGASLGAFGPFTLGDGLVTGGTAEDRFFGVTNLGGISAIRISMATSTDWEVDHLQYGRVAPAAAIPEPGTGALLVLGLLPAAGMLRRRRDRA